MGDLGSFLNMIGPILGIGNSLGLFGGNRGGQSQPTTGDVSGATHDPAGSERNCW